MVQKEAEGSVEELIPSHSNESGTGVFASNGSGVALMAKALVEFQDGPTNATGRGKLWRVNQWQPASTGVLAP